ncbi:MAG: tRNA threonylcarbamoyladenosine dehydratase [Tissierellales bacterium]|nr:tRNA threonylcarbamoyladenosine dehydratase [Tissierellales bacterium]MBN2827614.1 tRNA threonylcarbamoyladenosine dehydratase [Tissierellales bacterium]
MNPWQRTEILYGTESTQKLKETTVLIAGLGGVGSYAAEAIVRSAIGRLILVDQDAYDLSNLNRQLHSSIHVLNLPKTECLAEIYRSINPEAAFITRTIKITPDNVDSFFHEEKIDFVIDAIDDLPAKVALIKYCKSQGINIISCMGTGNRKDPQSFIVVDISKTFNCPLARKLRRILKQEGILKHTVVFSKELPIQNINCRKIGSNAFVPASAGLLLAAYVINKIVEER